MKHKAPIIILAEDDDDDFFFIDRAFQKLGSKLTLERVRDGEEAVKLLTSKAKKESAIPDLVILDLKMPRMNGFELLSWFRQQSKFAGVPALILSSSGEQRDIEKAYQLGATSYFVKPVKSSDLEELVRMVSLYWFDYCRLV